MQNNRKNSKKYYTKKISQGIVLTIIAFISLFTYKKDTLLAKVFLYETIPYLNIEQDMNMLFKFDTYENISAQNNTVETYISNEKTIDESKNENSDILENTTEIPVETHDEKTENTDLIGISNVIFQEENTGFIETRKEDIITKEDIEKLKDLEYLKNKFYIVSTSSTKLPQTSITSADFDVEKFLSTDLKIDNKISGPKVLIIHTHINEMFVDSDPKDLKNGIMGVGERLKSELENTYGIEVMHHKGVYDYVDGVSSRMGAYERMEIPVTTNNKG